MNKLLKVPRTLRYYSCNRLYSSAGAASNEPPIPNETKKDVATKYDHKNTSKEDLAWRSSWLDKEDQTQRLDPLRSFSDDTNQIDTLKIFQTPINLAPSAIKKWWNDKQEFKEIALQSYFPERNQTVGNELAAAHFLLYRGGSVKFHNADKWIKADDKKQYNLTRYKDPNKVLQAIDFTGMNLYYEALSNFKDLKNVEWAIFNDVENLDDWFLDRISGIFKHSLVYLDIRNCPNYTERGLGALYKMEKLAILRIDDMLMTKSFEMTCLMLQEHNPNLQIKIG